MLARFIKPTALKAAGLALNGRLAKQQARFLATVESTVEGSAGRAVPVTRPRATPITHDRATFTIRVSQMAVWRVEEED